MTKNTDNSVKKPRGKGKPFVKGNSGKPIGAKNLITKTVKETVLAAFNELQKDPLANIVSWGKSNPGMFYQIAAKLIPTEISGTIGVEVKQVFKIGNVEIEL